jgi:hypothetical protein
MLYSDIVPKLGADNNVIITSLRLPLRIEKDGDKLRIFPSKVLNLYRAFSRGHSLLYQIKIKSNGLEYAKENSTMRKKR